jgi:drug/metabolite transporter (DMT)-like permease
VKQPLSAPAAHALMHLTVFVWGFTAILGKLISISAVPLVWYRVLVVVLVMPAVIAWRRLPFAVPSGVARRFALVGLFVAAHWLLFYGCIKYAGVPVAVLCLSTTTFFTALIEPLVFSRRADARELLVGFGVMLGVSFLVKVETHADSLGLAMGLACALFSAAFGALNGRLARECAGEVMTFWELLLALGFTTLFFLVRPGDFVAPWSLSTRDAAYLLVLSIGCTVLPWLWSLRVLQTLKPYTLALAVSLEPVYAMVLAYFLFPSAQALTIRFYGGAALLLMLVAFNTWRRRAE